MFGFDDRLHFGLEDESQIRPGIAELLKDAVLCAASCHRPVPAAAEVIDLGSVVGELLVKDSICLGFQMRSACFRRSRLATSWLASTSWMREDSWSKRFCILERLAIW